MIGRRKAMGYRQEISYYKRGDVYYCRGYDENGNRTSGKSTGQTTKTAAKEWAKKHFDNGELSVKNEMRFRDYAEDWWKWDKCLYVKTRRAKGRIGIEHVDVCRSYLDNHIMPYFGKLKLSKISPGTIDTWLLKLDEEGKITRVTINHCLTTLKTMLKEARRRGLLLVNPAEDVTGFSAKSKEKGILKMDEFKKLFAEGHIDWEIIDRVWNGSLLLYSVNILAAHTGMRMGETQALLWRNVHPESIYVEYAWSRKSGLGDPKGGARRHITIPSVVADSLTELRKVSPYTEPDDFVFYGEKGRQKPLYHKTILKGLYRALKNIGIPENERSKRNITFHSWRHFLNSQMRKNGISDTIVQRITGHRTQEMTEHYTHFDISAYTGVAEIQEKMLCRSDPNM
jgi:integrase